MERLPHSRTAILAAMLEALERREGTADRVEVASSIRRRILGSSQSPDPELDAMITQLIRRALVAEWITVAHDAGTLQIGAEGLHVLKLHRQGEGTLSRLIRRPRSQVMGNRGPA